MVYGKYMKGGRPAKRKFVKKAASRYVNAVSAQYGRAPELKFSDYPSTVTALTSTTACVTLNSVAPGSEGYQRVGRGICMKGIEIKIYFDLKNTSGSNDALRVALVYDRQPQNVVPTFADVFTSTDNVGGTTTDSFTFPNPGNNERFKILMDYHTPLDFTTTIATVASDPNKPCFIHRFIPLRGLETKYGIGSTIPSSGGLFLVARGILASGSESFNMIFTSRLSYTDV